MILSNSIFNYINLHSETFNQNQRYQNQFHQNIGGLFVTGGKSENVPQKQDGHCAQCSLWSQHSFHPHSLLCQSGIGNPHTRLHWPFVVVALNLISASLPFYEGNGMCERVSLAQNLLLHLTPLSWGRNWPDSTRQERLSLNRSLGKSSQG